MDNQETQVRPIFKDGITRLKMWWPRFNSKDVNIMDATSAYSRATYGENVSRETLIKMHQNQICKLIRDKITFNYDKTNTFGYMCVYAFTEDVVPFIDDILQPFKENGYVIMNLSEKVGEELKDGHVYLLSWYKKSL